MIKTARRSSDVGSRDVHGYRQQLSNREDWIDSNGRRDIPPMELHQDKKTTRSAAPVDWLTSLCRP